MTRDDKSLRTPRLRLIPVEASNASTLWELMQNQELRTYQDLPDLERLHFTALVTSGRGSFRANKPGRFEWLIEHQNRTVIGWVSLRVGDRSAQSGEIGYSLLAEYRGHGFATEAVKALVEEAFSRGKLRKLRAYCLPENRASRALLRRVGFHEDGILKRGASLRGRAVDVVSYVLEAHG